MVEHPKSSVTSANSDSLSTKAHHGAFLIDRLPNVRGICLAACRADGTTEWEIEGSFYELVEHQFARSVSP